jgi:hypothetical protein
MMAKYFTSASKSKLLTAQIRDAERQVSIRQREVGVRADKLVQKVYQRMTAPATLLMACGSGFVFGELTKRQTTQFRGTADTSGTVATTPLKTTLNLITSARTLYTAVLPLAWMMKSFQQRGASNQAQERRCHPVAAASGAATEGQGDN